MKVLKFGGTSVATPEAIGRLVRIVSSAAKQEKIIVVCSAISKCTDALIKIGHKAASSDSSAGADIETLKCRHHALIESVLNDRNKVEALSECDAEFERLSAFAQSISAEGTVSEASLDHIQTFGELLSTRIIARCLSEEGGVAVQWIDSRQIVRKSGQDVDFEATNANISQVLAAHPDTEVFVAQGFIASDKNGAPVTLGRGGSDFSASIYAAGSCARVVEIWTDVPGIMTSDPKKIPFATTIPYLSYASARAMAEFGAKVLYPPTVEPARKAGIPICILNSFEPDAQGSLIIANPPHCAEGPLGLTSLPSSELGRLPADMIVPKVQNCSSEMIVLVGNSLPDNASARAEKALQRIAHSPVQTAGDNVFVEVDPENSRDALMSMHREFFEFKPLEVVHLFIAGYGAVGHALTALIRDHVKEIAGRSGKFLRIAGVSNSSKFVINAAGIRPADIDTLLPYGQEASGGAFFDAIGQMALRNAVVVDCTDSESIGARYEEFFRRGMSVVSCNRRAFAVPYARYSAMKAAAADYGLSLKYDTTVGTSLPVLESIAGNAFSGERTAAIEAVVSCTLNNIITSYDGANTESIATLLRRAQDIGLTEKDPRSDLGGKDALRKLLILAREAGFPLEADEVEITPMLGKEFFDCGIDEFYQKLSAWEPRFIERENELDNMGMRQRFVASIRRDATAPKGYKAQIKMELVGMESPFFWISGTENVVIIRNEGSAPLVIKGPGEGSLMAASSVLNNILSL